MAILFPSKRRKEVPNLVAPFNINVGEKKKEASWSFNFGRGKKGMRSSHPTPFFLQK